MVICLQLVAPYAIVSLSHKDAQNLPRRLPRDSGYRNTSQLSSKSSSPSLQRHSRPIDVDRSPRMTPQHVLGLSSDNVSRKQHRWTAESQLQKSAAKLRQMQSAAGITQVKSAVELRHRQSPSELRHMQSAAELHQMSSAGDMHQMQSASRSQPSVRSKERHSGPPSNQLWLQSSGNNKQVASAANSYQVRSAGHSRQSSALDDLSETSDGCDTAPSTPSSTREDNTSDSEGSDTNPPVQGLVLTNKNNQVVML